MGADGCLQALSLAGEEVWPRGDRGEARPSLAAVLGTPSPSLIKTVLSSPLRVATPGGRHLPKFGSPVFVSTLPHQTALMPFLPFCRADKVTPESSSLQECLASKGRGSLWPAWGQRGAAGCTAGSGLSQLLARFLTSLWFSSFWLLNSMI